MLFFIFVFMVFLGFINLCVVDYIIWWSVFVVCTFIFVFFLKDNFFYSSLVNYYLIQEVCGFYFLVFNNWKLQFLIVMLKSGSAPFHFWLFSVLSGIKKWFLMWFLTFQKLPYFVVLINFCSEFFFLFLFFGMVFCYFQFFLLRGSLDMLVIMSTESFNWLLFLSLFSFNEVFFLVFFYYIVMFFIISYIYGDLNFFSLETVLVFFNIPLTITFFLKISVLFSGGNFVGLWFLFLLMIMLLMSLGIGFWFFYVSMAGYNVGVKFYDYYMFILLLFMLFVYF